jgi:ankyrin repeat protein
LVAEINFFAYFEVFDNEQRSPLHYAAQQNLGDVAALLVQAGATNDTRDCYNVTPARNKQTLLFAKNE